VREKENENYQSNREDRMKKAKTPLVVIFLLIFFAASSFAQPAKRMMRANRSFDRVPHSILFVLRANQEELGITDEQMEQIQNIVFIHQEKMLRMENENRLHQLELQKLMQERENLDYDKIEAILSKTSDIRNQMFIERLKLRDEIGKILTPEQKDALKAMEKEGFGRRFQMMREKEDRLPQMPRMRSRPIK
jgi:Spy/CpxP family protein refolding chaperone